MTKDQKKRADELVLLIKSQQEHLNEMNSYKESEEPFLLVDGRNHSSRKLKYISAFEMIQIEAFRAEKELKKLQDEFDAL